LFTSFENNLGIFDSLDMGRQLLIKHLLPFLKIGDIYEDFNRSGKIPDKNNLLNNEVIVSYNECTLF